MQKLRNKAQILDKTKFEYMKMQPQAAQLYCERAAFLLP